jgi:hypothetical protein
MYSSYPPTTVSYIQTQQLHINLQQLHIQKSKYNDILYSCICNIFIVCLAGHLIYRGPLLREKNVQNYSYNTKGFTQANLVCYHYIAVYKNI